MEGRSGVIASLDIGWAAGFLEGEGSFFYARNAGSELRLSASQKEREPLDRLHRLFGGAVTVERRIIVWNASGSRAAGIMLTIFAEMSPRRQGQIARALSVWRARPPQPHPFRKVCQRGHPYSVEICKGKERRFCHTCKLDRLAIRRRRP